MTYRAVDRHDMIEGTPFRVEQLKFRTFVFRFLALVDTIDNSSRHTFSIFPTFFSLLIISLSNSNQASNEQLNCNIIVWSQ